MAWTWKSTLGLAWGFFLFFPLPGESSPRATPTSSKRSPFLPRAIIPKAVSLLKQGGWRPENIGYLETMIPDSAREGVAVFDLDGTLIQGDVDTTLHRHLIQELGFKFSPQFWNLIPEAYGRSQLERLYLKTSSLPLDQARETKAYQEFVQGFLSIYEAMAEQEGEKAVYAWSLKLLSGFSEEELAALSEEVLERYLGKDLKIYPQMQELAQRMQEAGWRVYIVSGSNDWIVKAMSRRLGIPGERALGSRLQVENGVLTDRIERLHYGADKALTVRKEIGDILHFAAGDSEGDLPMLLMARHRLVLNDAKPNQEYLRRMAEEGVWRLQYVSEFDGSLSGWFFRGSEGTTHKGNLNLHHGDSLGGTAAIKEFRKISSAWTEEEISRAVESVQVPPDPQAHLSFWDRATAKKLSPSFREAKKNPRHAERLGRQYWRALARGTDPKVQEALFYSLKDFPSQTGFLCTVHALAHLTGIPVDQVLSLAEEMVPDVQEVGLSIPAASLILHRLNIPHRFVPRKDILHTLALDRRPMLVTIKPLDTLHAVLLTPWILHYQGKSLAVLLDSNLEGWERTFVPIDNLPWMMRADAIELMPR